MIPLAVNSQRIRLPNIPEHDKKPLHFGFSLGLNMMDFSIEASEFAVDSSFFGEVSTLSAGFNINIVSNFRLNDFFDFRMLPGVAFGQRRIDFYDLPGGTPPGSGNWGPGDTILFNNSQNLESSYIEFPFLIKYKAVRIGNYRPYLLGGVNFRYDLARNFSDEDGVHLSLKPFDTFFEAGFGVDFYFPYFKFSTEIKYSMGFFNRLNPTESRSMKYQNSIEQLRSNLIVFSFHFE